MLAITAGEPAGIGPELILKLALQPRSVPWVVIADLHMMRARAQLLDLPVRLDSVAIAPSMDAGTLSVLHVPLAEPAQPGQLSPANAKAVLQTLETAAHGALGGRFSAIVTAPVQKSVIIDAGHAFSGHTEYFCERAGVADVVMMLVAGAFRVALATTHLPLRAVPDAITTELLVRRLSILLQALRTQFGIPQPRVLVTGLNPHAGEGGHLGSEDDQVIRPVCDAFRARGELVRGPLPADTAFTPAKLTDCDAVFAMYHDQGLPVLKHAGFGNAVNVTLGLPFIRTSVDHGTALDIAGRGTADTGSLAAAIALATALISRESA